jgi:hypothetical protein
MCDYRHGLCEWCCCAFHRGLAGQWWRETHAVSVCAATSWNAKKRDNTSIGVIALVI